MGAEQSQFETWRTSFAGAVPATDYDTYRPGYPDEAVRWVLGVPDTHPDMLDVLDLGAGTGILTSAVERLGHRVVAVDPSEAMLEALALRLPGVDARGGTAEQIPLADASVDAVVLGQAWHWVDPDVAGPEVARVLRPGGWLGLLWNSRDSTVPWVAELYQVAGEPVRERGGGDEPPRVTGPFGALEQATLDNPHLLPSAEAVGRLAGTWSWVRTGPDPDRVMAQVVEVAARHASSDGSVAVPQQTECFRVRRH